MKTLGGFLEGSAEELYCPICGDYLLIFTYTHMKKHGISQAQFLKKWPDFAHLHYWPDAPGHRSRIKFIKIRAALALEGTPK